MSLCPLSEANPENQWQQDRLCWYLLQTRDKYLFWIYSAKRYFSLLIGNVVGFFSSRTLLRERHNAFFQQISRYLHSTKGFRRRTSGSIAIFARALASAGRVATQKNPKPVLLLRFWTQYLLFRGSNTGELSRTWISSPQACWNWSLRCLLCRNKRVMMSEREDSVEREEQRAPGEPAPAEVRPKSCSNHPRFWSGSCLYSCHGILGFSK